MRSVYLAIGAAEQGHRGPQRPRHQRRSTKWRHFRLSSSETFWMVSSL